MEPHNTTAEERKKIAVLVVEDESLIRLDAVDMVEDCGFTAYEAGNGLEALRTLEQNPNILVVFTDIDMPGMNGLELAAEVRKRWPHIALLITSGHVKVRFDEMPVEGKFFRKPYRAAEITQEIIRAIQAE